MCDVGWLVGSAGNANGSPGDDPSTGPDPRPTTPLAVVYGELVSANHAHKTKTQHNQQTMQKINTNNIINKTFVRL